MNELEKAQRQFEQAKARVQKLKAKARSEDRKRDTRRKVILGGVLLAEARKTPGIRQRVEQWISSLPEKDRSAFEGWSLESEV
ncbi:mobilization protein [Novispirillum itersonii]|uniref:Putative cell wall-binding protein n=1 Tax=Novispirillum itersonii TaxID=189 RepID=A0A7W9ZJ92_NOVIT|nr:mobilization protein [Novispirillum itersonii]MBB6212526.1 putative cell wall-binding protein [Novispirillum itersonii]